MATTVGEIGEILRLIEASPFEEVIIEIEGTRITARRPAAGQSTGQSRERPASAPARRSGPQSGATAASAQPLASFAPPAVASTRPAAPPPRDNLAQGLIAVRAPMVGTFFRRSAPDQPVFVEQGQTVTAGQPLCLIEVMKLYTVIEATTDGVLEAILVDDGSLVEYDQPLFAIRETGA